MIFNKKGFTLIELLVVIAIIGILASIVLVSFPTATKKAKDSRVVSAIAQARIAMETLYANQSSYSGFTTANPTEMVAIDTEVSNNSGTANSLKAVFGTGLQTACVYSGLQSALSGTTYSKWYCADSSGKAGFTIIDPAALCVGTAAAVACPAVTG